MHKLLLFAALLMISIASCQKSSDDNGPYTCTCEYLIVTGSYQHDTTTNNTYPNGTTLSIAQQNCNNNKTSLLASGYNPNCYIK